MKILKGYLHNIIKATNKIYYLDDEKQKQLYIYDSKKDNNKMYEFKIQFNEDGTPYVLLLNPLIILSTSNYINFILTFNLNELYYIFIENDDFIDGDHQWLLIQENIKIIDSMFETLPFKNDEEEEEWRTTLETFKCWDDFEALTLKIAKRLINKN